MEDIHHIREIEAVSQGAAASRDPAVVESWLRCLRKHGLDPAARSEAYILPETQLRAHRQQSEKLIAIARSGIESLYRLVAGQNYVLLLADRSGVTVEYLGDAVQKEALRRSGLYLGSEWSEARAGTCALGACIETGEALIVHQSDHFDVTHGGLSCTAAPIYDTAGQLSAVLDISLLCSPAARTSQSLALNLVRQAARRVEMANLMAESRGEWVLRLSGRPDFLDVDPEAALSLDGSGCVIGMTHGAARLLARAGGQDWRHPGEILGRPLSDFLNVALEGLDDLTRQRPAPDRLIETRDGHRLFAHAIEPRRSTTPRPVSAALRDLAGGDPAMAQVVARASALAPTPVLIEGETGTGKMTLARAIHDAGRGGPFVVVPCAELTDDDAALIFGRVQGQRMQDGLVAAAQRGTLVFDKIDELPPRLQARLLRLVAEGSYLPVGGVRPRIADLRIVATSQADLSSAVRTDLFHRLGGAPLRLPPLHARRDVLALAARLFARPIAPDAMGALAAHRWPGNLREMANLATTLGPGPVTLADLPEIFRTPDAPPEAGSALLLHLLRDCGGNVSEVARKLGVDRSTVHRRMRRLGLAAAEGRIFH